MCTRHTQAGRRAGGERAEIDITASERASHLSELAEKEVSVLAELNRFDSRANDDGFDAAGIDDSHRNERATTVHDSPSKLELATPTCHG